MLVWLRHIEAVPKTASREPEMTLQLATQWFPQVFAPLIEFLRKMNGPGKIHKKLGRHEEVAADPNTTRGLGPQRRSP